MNSRRFVVTDATISERKRNGSMRHGTSGLLFPVFTSGLYFRSTTSAVLVFTSATEEKKNHKIFKIMLNLTQKDGHFEWVRLQQATHYKHFSHFVTKLRNIQETLNTRKQSHDLKGLNTPVIAWTNRTVMGFTVLMHSYLQLVQLLQLQCTEWFTQSSTQSQ